MGAKANLITISDVKEMKLKPQIRSNQASLKTYNGQDTEPQGVCRLRVLCDKNKTHHLLFILVQDNLPAFIGGEKSVLHQ